MGIMRRDMEDIKKDPNELVEIKNTVSELKHTWDGINSRLDTAKEKKNEFEYTAKEPSETQKKAEERWPEHQWTVGQYQAV